MKTLIATIIVTSMAVTRPAAQTNVDIEFDVGKNKFTTNRKSLKFEDYQFTIKGYNHILYSPVVKVVAMRHKVVAPDALKPYVSFVDFQRDIDLGLFNMPMITPTVLDEQAIIASQIKSKNQELLDVENDISANAEKLKTVNEKLAQNRRASNKLPPAAEKILEDESNILMGEKIDLELNQKTISADLMTLKRRYAARQPNPIVRTVNLFNTEYQRLLAVERIFDTLREALKNNSTPGCSQAADAARLALLNEYSIPNDPNNIQTKLNDLTTEFNRSVNTCAALSKSLSLQLAGRSASIDAQTQTTIDQALIASEYVATKKSELQGLMATFSKLFPKSQTFQSKPYSHKNDYASVSIKMVSNLDSKDTVLRQNIRLYTKGGLDIDFSTGGLFDNIYKRNWYVDTVGVNSIRMEKIPDRDWAWGVLMNASYRISHFARMGISAGPAVSFTDGGVRYMLGGHVYLGKRDLIGISSGMCFGKRNYLSATLSDDGTDPKAILPKDLTTVATYEKWARGFYFGLFYNFARL